MNAFAASIATPESPVAPAAPQPLAAPPPAARIVRHLAPCRTERRAVGGTMTRVCTEHPNHRHLVARPGARVAERADGKWLIQESCGGVAESEGDPDVPWYVCALPFNQTCGSVARPYIAGGVPNPDNPPPAGSMPQTDNITRHWAGIMPSVGYYLSVPPYAPQGVNTNIFANVTGFPVVYTYANFIADINAVIGAITSHPNIALGPANYFGTTNIAYEPSVQTGVPPQTMGAGNFVWDTCML